MPQESSPAAPGEAPALGLAARVLEELGLLALYRSCLDTKLLCLQRFVRLFAYGSSTLILVSFLKLLGHPESKIGLFMTLTLAGDVCISFVLTLIADAFGRKAILGLGSLLMAGSGIAFASFENYWILLAAAIFGVISPSGNEIGPFRAVEESIVAHLTPAADRGNIYAWYSLIGTAGAALGMMTCGWTLDYLRDVEHWSPKAAYKSVFIVYAAVGFLKFLLTIILSQNVEAEERQQKKQNDGEREPLLANGNGRGSANEEIVQRENQPKKPKKKSLLALLPEISNDSKIIVLQLSLLLGLDSFASGLASLSWSTYYFKWKFDLEERKLGSLFFTTNIIAAASMLIAASIARRFGNVKTMVFTHMPSAICLALIGIPESLHFAMLFLILRSCTQSMDVGPRSAFLAAIILPAERTAVMGATNVVKTFAQSLGPLITGILVTKKLFWVVFLAAGCLKVTYDLGMLAVFSRHQVLEERERLEREREETTGRPN